MRVSEPERQVFLAIGGLFSRNNTCHLQLDADDHFIPFVFES
jgi:hypothetical protein